ncbi:hypothetical protein [Mycolicibacterium goodii]|nr:hypothetical protein [Mycolicibacterium goodii]
MPAAFDAYQDFMIDDGRAVALDGEIVPLGVVDFGSAWVHAW